MSRRQYPSRKSIRKNERSEQGRYALIQPGQIGEAAAEDNGGRIEDVDHHRQPARQAAFVARKDGLCANIAGSSRLGDLVWAPGSPGAALVLTHPTRDTDSGLQGNPFPHQHRSPGRSSSIGAGTGVWPHSPGIASVPMKMRP